MLSANPEPANNVYHPWPSLRKKTPTLGCNYAEMKSRLRYFAGNLVRT